MRVQDKIRGHRIARQRNTGMGFGQLGPKVADELPVPHHSGYVAAPADTALLSPGMKITAGPRREGDAVWTLLLLGGREVRLDHAAADAVTVILDDAAPAPVERADA